MTPRDAIRMAVANLTDAAAAATRGLYGDGRQEHLESAVCHAEAALVILKGIMEPEAGAEGRETDPENGTG